MKYMTSKTSFYSFVYKILSDLIKRRINICHHKKIITNHHNRKNLYGAHMYAFATYITLNQLMRILVFIIQRRNSHLDRGITTTADILSCNMWQWGVRCCNFVILGMANLRNKLPKSSTGSAILHLRKMNLSIPNRNFNPLGYNNYQNVNTNMV